MTATPYKEKIYLVDVSSLFFRAFFAIRELTSPQGLPVNAIYGFLSMISRLLKEENPKYFVFCYDRKEPSFRKEIFPEYKAHRSEMPDDLQKQLPYIYKLAELLGIPTFESPGFEADDFIGAITKWAEKKHLEVYIVSSDKDFAQLVNPHVTLYDTMKNIRYTPQGVEEKWGIKPHQMIDYLAIVGDASDNIPGVKGIGEKGALKLLQEYQTLENIYNHIDEIQSKSLKEKLLQSKDMAFLSQKLVTIETNIPLPDQLTAYQLKPIATQELRTLLRELNFKALEANLLGDSPLNENNTQPQKAQDTQLSLEVQNTEGFANTEGSTHGEAHEQPPLATEFQMKSMKNAEELLKDLETTTEPLELWGLSDPRGFYIVHKNTIYTLENSPNESPEIKQPTLENPAESLGPALSKLNIQWKGFNLKEFWHLIKAEMNAENSKPIWDSMLAAYVLRASDCSDFKKVYERTLKKSYAELGGVAYFINAHLELEEQLQQNLKSLNAEKIFQEIELPLIPILYKMEQRGIKIDLDHLKNLSEQSSIEIKQLEEQIFTLAKHPFNVSSPKQLAVILFEELGLPVIKKTKTGYSTDTDVLEQLNHPIAPLILEHRELSKLKNTYIDPLPLLADPQHHRLHTRFNQALTTTGRLSSESPNLQNIPIRSPRGQLVRKAFISEDSKQLVSLDYSQIELRILAHLSNDPGLIKAFTENLDIHAATASEVFNVPLEQVTSDQRRIAKAVNFGIAYGQGAFGLAEALGIPRGESQQIIKKYFQKFPN
nr:DNA polymerase I [Pseudobdellovibrionaceae bacterium]